MGGRLELKLRMVADEYAVAVVAVLVVFTLAGGGLIYTTYVAPGTETTEEVLAEWETTGEYTHSATVTNGTAVFPLGATLSDRSVYYTQIAPILDTEFRYGFTGADVELNVEGETTLVIRSVDDGGDGDSTEFWRQERRLDTFSGTVAAGETVSSTTSVNVSAVAAEVEAIQEGLGASPGTTEVRIRTAVSATGDIAGGSESYRSTQALTLEPGDGTYTVETPEPAGETDQRTRSVTTERSYGLPRRVGGPALFVVGLLGLAGFAAASYRDAFEVTAAERRSLEFADRREDLDDWISRGSVGGLADGREAVRIDTLDDLVDIAIDTDERVLEDTERRGYYVPGGDICYVYEPDPEIDIDRFRD